MAHAARHLGRDHRGGGSGDFGNRGDGSECVSDSTAYFYISNSLALCATLK